MVPEAPGISTWVEKPLLGGVAFVDTATNCTPRTVEILSRSASMRAVRFSRLAYALVRRGMPTEMTLCGS